MGEVHGEVEKKGECGNSVPRYRESVHIQSRTGEEVPWRGRKTRRTFVFEKFPRLPPPSSSPRSLVLAPHVPQSAPRFFPQGLRLLEWRGGRPPSEHSSTRIGRACRFILSSSLSREICPFQFLKDFSCSRMGRGSGGIKFYGSTWEQERARGRFFGIPLWLPFSCSAQVCTFPQKTRGS